MRYASSAAKTWGASRSASEKTATDAIPISRSVRITRIAISPRFATSTLWIGRAGTALWDFGDARGDLGVMRCGLPSERNVAVLLRRQRLPLVRQHAERADQSRTRLLGLDHVVEIAEPRRDVRIRELLVVLLDERGPRPGRIL